MAFSFATKIPVDIYFFHLVKSIINSSVDFTEITIDSRVLKINENTYKILTIQIIIIFWLIVEHSPQI